MSQPIFVDPVLDGAADPTVIWNEAKREWWMFYTNRRAHFGGDGHDWIHGSPIGIAVSPDGWTWTYRGTAQGLDPIDNGVLNTHWAPEVIRADDGYHMYLTYMDGTPVAFETSVRRMLHLTSPDLETWTHRGTVDMPSPNLIDACVIMCPDGLWRLWYKDESRGSCTQVATSRDLFDWTYEREVIPGRSSGGNPHEGPNVFELGGWFWMIVDEWHGQAVFRSDDATTWQRQGIILDSPGTDPMDRCFARHADVVPQADWAAIYYFTHPQWDEASKPRPITGEERRTVIHVARAWVEDGVLKASRDVEPFTLTASASASVNTDTFDLPPAIAGLVAAQQRLREHYAAVGLKFTFDGNLVGDLGEAIAAELFGIELVEAAATMGIDGYARDGRSVQVKATGS